MEKNSFLKKLTKSNLGLAKMHDTYITVPKKKVNPVVFFGNPPKDIRVKDKTSNRYFNFPFKKQANGEYRLTKFTEYFYFKKADLGDNVYIEKTKRNKNKYCFEIDLIKNIRKQDKFIYPDELSFADELKLHEGAKIMVTVNKYERNQKAREECIKYWKALCAVCELEFVNKYGEIGEGFIHVHHKIPISEIGKKYEINPINDLIPVCPNCHSMIHKRNPPYTIEEVKEKLV
jgi:hypothetical protein